MQKHEFTEHEQLYRVVACAVRRRSPLKLYCYRISNLIQDPHSHLNKGHLGILIDSCPLLRSGRLLCLIYIFKA